MKVSRITESFDRLCLFSSFFSLSKKKRFCSPDWSPRVRPAWSQPPSQPLSQPRSQRHRFQQLWRSEPTRPATTRTLLITRLLRRTSPALWSPTPRHSPIPAFPRLLWSPAGAENSQASRFEDNPFGGNIRLRFARWDRPWRCLRISTISEDQLGSTCRSSCNNGCRLRFHRVSLSFYPYPSSSFFLVTVNVDPWIFRLSYLQKKKKKKKKKRIKKIFIKVILFLFISSSRN